jgi:hypothetical protein
MKRKQPSQDLSIDDAVAEFRILLEEQRAQFEGSATPGTPDVAAEDPEAMRFRLAEQLLSELCPGPAACADPLCRRRRECRNMADLRRPPEPEGRRPPGAVALRRAMWMYCNAMRASAAEK